MRSSDEMPTGTPSNPTLLVTRELRKSFGETHAVDGLDFVVQEGEVLALVGRMERGKPLW